MYMYPVIASNTTVEANTNLTSTTHMPRNRSASTTSTSSSPPALLTRGFASLRRAHRRLSTSSPSSPIQQEITNTTPEASLSDSSSIRDTRPTEQDSAPVVRPRIRLVPNVGLSSRSFVFEVIDRELEPGVTYRIGRFSDRNALSDRLSFKSKVVSRSHAEIWTEQGKVCLFYFRYG
jgi:pSer/pThr/pTyr-binding forkhead associated (FHA) protein